MERIDVTVRVNGEEHHLSVEPCRTLAEVVREDLALSGTHLACEHGVCGACTVALDGEAVRSCLTLAVQADGRVVETVEGLARSGEFDPLQEAMAEAHAFQCAFCAPGFLMTLRCALARNPRPSRGDIKEELAGNLCRCTGYASILAGVDAALERMGGDDDA